VILVARTFPIRVAGHSGPLHGETSWDAVGVKPEQTTVTLKTRRVGIWDEQLVNRSIRLNGADEIALTFLDYVYPEVVGAQSWEQLGIHALEFVDHIQSRVGVPITMAGIGGEDFTVLRASVRGSVHAHR
jgi:adenylosuccinate synthase